MRTPLTYIFLRLPRLRASPLSYIGRPLLMPGVLQEQEPLAANLSAPSSAPTAATGECRHLRPSLPPPRRRAVGRHRAPRLHLALLVLRCRCWDRGFARAFFLRAPPFRPPFLGRYGGGFFGKEKVSGAFYARAVPPVRGRGN